MSKPFKQTFPVLNESIISGRVVIPTEMKIFDIDNIAAYWIHHDQWEFSYDKDFGPLRLPYRAMWVEHGTHRNESQQAGILDAGWVLIEYPPGSPGRPDLEYREDPHPDQYLIVAYLFNKTGHLNQHGVWTWVTKDGEWVTSLLDFPENSVFIRGLGVDAARDELTAMHKPVMLAVGLANCKNIAVDDMATRKERKSRRASKQRFSGTEYKVIRLPGAPSNRIDGNVPTNRESRLHTVRGHFKTYTDENPLFGRLTGTWWWPPTARGNKKNGEIISSYKQSVPQK